MAIRKNSNELFTCRDPLYPLEVLPPMHMVANQHLVLLLMVGMWLEEHASTAFTPHVQDGESVVRNMIFFKSLSDREEFETWYSSLKVSEILLDLLPEFDVDTLLDTEDSLSIAGRVSHRFSLDYRYNQEEFIENYPDVCAWLIKHAKRTKGQRIWYDYTRDCFFFEDGRLAVNFKLKFTVDEQLEETKTVKVPNIPTTGTKVNPKWTSSAVDDDYYHYEKLRRHRDTWDDRAESIIDSLNRRRRLRDDT